MNFRHLLGCDTIEGQWNHKNVNCTGTPIYFTTYLSRVNCIGFPHKEMSRNLHPHDLFSMVCFLPRNKSEFKLNVKEHAM